MTPEVELALKTVIAELESKWPVPYVRTVKNRQQHMIGYCRERGRAPIIADTASGNGDA